eukprot:sb/3464859/
MATMVRPNYKPVDTSTPTKIPVYQFYDAPSGRQQLPSLRDMTTYQPNYQPIRDQYSVSSCSIIRQHWTVVSGGKRLDTRKHSEDLTTRDKGLKGKLSSLSLEHINTNNVLYCVRDSLELKTGATVERSKVVPGVQAASTLPRSYRQTNKKQVEIKPANGTQKGSYAAMYAARRQQLDKQEHQRARLLAKQRDENGRKWDTNENTTAAQDIAAVGPPGYPHTLPSAMYPHAQHPLVFHEPIDVSSRYFGDILLPTAVSPLPPIETSEDDDQDDSSQKKDASPSPKKDSYSSPKPKITYKPYTLQEYKGVRAGYVRKVGGLGPDTENTKYKEKLSKAKRMNEYAQKLRDQHKMSEFPKRMAKPKRPPPSKATVAMQYAKSIPPPKPTKPYQRRRTESCGSEGNQQDPANLKEEILEERVRRHFIHKRMMADLEKL